MSKRPVSDTSEALKLFREYYEKAPLFDAAGDRDRDFSTPEDASRTLQFGGPESHLFRPRKDASGKFVVNSGPGWYDIQGFDDGSLPSMDLFVDPNQPFTGVITAREPLSGLVKETTLSDAGSGSWLALYLILYNLMVEQLREEVNQAGTLDAKRRAQVDFVNENAGQLQSLYSQVQLISENRDLNAESKKVARQILSGLDELLKSRVSIQVVNAMSEVDQATLRATLDRLQEELTMPQSRRTVNDATAIQYLNTIAILAARDPQLNDLKEEALATRQFLEAQQQQRIEASVADLSELIADLPRDLQVELVNAANVYLESDSDVVIPTRANSAKYGANRDNVIVFYAALARLQSEFSEPMQKRIRCALNKEYGYLDEKLMFKRATKGPFSARTEYFPPNLRAAIQEQAKVSGKGVQPVCGTMKPADVNKFISSYSSMHDLIVTTLVFYYASCKQVLDGSADGPIDVTPLARDWLKFLAAGPFKKRTKSLSAMNVDEWAAVSPQSFFNNTIGDIALTMNSVRDSLADLNDMALEIVDACTISRAAAGELDPYDKSMLLLAEFVADFYDKFNKLSGGLIQWELSAEDGKVYIRNPAAIQRECQRIRGDVAPRPAPAAGNGNGGNGGQDNTTVQVEAAIEATPEMLSVYTEEMREQGDDYAFTRPEGSTQIISKLNAIPVDSTATLKDLGEAVISAFAGVDYIEDAYTILLNGEDVTNSTDTVQSRVGPDGRIAVTFTYNPV